MRVRPRVLGLLLVAGGIGLGSLAASGRPLEIPRVGNEFVLAADFHVHAFVGDGGVAPWALRREARLRGLNVITISNHNQLLAARMGTWRIGESSPDDPLVIVGQEVTAPEFHLIAAGITETIDWRLSARDAIHEVHRQGGVAIAAHAARGSWKDDDPVAVGLLDGVEVAHPGALQFERARRELQEMFEKSRAGNPAVAPIGSSDFHFGGRLGRCRTYVFADEVSERGVLDAIRRGRTVAYDGDGRLTGSPERVRAVESLIARHPPPLTTDGLSRLASGLALAGLAVLLLFR